MATLGGLEQDKYEQTTPRQYCSDCGSGAAAAAAAAGGGNVLMR